MSLALAVADDANPVRNPPVRCFRVGPVVQIQFTDFAVGVRTRFHTLFGAPAEEVARRLVGELNLSPRDLQVKAQQLGDVAVLRRMPADLPLELRPGAVMPVAFVEGLTEAQLAAALAAVAANPFH